MSESPQRQPQPPPWWPEGEEWPPADWSMARRRFVPRIAALMLGLLLLLLTFCVVIGALYWNLRPRRRRRRHFALPFGAILLLGLLAYAGTRGFRSLRDNATALDEVMSSVNQIAAGNYDVHPAERGWGETRELARSVDLMAGRLRTAEARRIALQADLAHELRTPLSVIQGTTEGMLDGVYPRDDEHLLLVVRRSRMMAGLLDDFRTLSTAEAGVLQLHREQFDLAALLDGIVADYREEGARKGIAVDRAGTSPLVVSLDAVRMGEVVDNLMKNALRYTGTGDSIELGAGRLDGTIQIWVRDTGAGIPPERIDAIFDRYAKSSDSGGSGLGLAIARRLVEAHGGTISVVSALDEGATFSISIPDAG